MTDNPNIGSNLGPTVVITRPEPQASRFAAQLREALPKDVMVEVCPLTRFELTDPGKAPSYDWVAFTSENGVRAADQLLGPDRGRAFAVGDRTAAVARELGWDSVSARGDGIALAHLIAQHDPSGRGLWPCGRDVQPGFLDTALSLGIEIRPWVVYRIDQTQQKIAAKGSIVLPVFSPNGARLAARAVTGPVICVAISDAAANAFGPSDQLIVAKRPDASAMIAAVASIFPKPVP